MNISQCWYKKVCTNQCSNYCIRYNLMQALYRQSHLPEAQWIYRSLWTGNRDRTAFRTLANINIVDFVKNGSSLYIWSHTCGNGKTSWAIRLMHKYFDAIWHESNFDCKAVFINTQKFLYDCKRSISHEVEGFDELCKQIQTADLVIWDDISCTRITEYEHQIIFQYVDDRQSCGKANIFTGNRDIGECYDLIGDRLTSRVWSGISVEFKEEDKRRLGEYGGTTNYKQTNLS